MKTEGRKIKRLERYLKKHLKECGSMEDLYDIAEKYERKNNLEFDGVFGITERIADKRKRFLND